MAGLESRLEKWISSKDESLLRISNLQLLIDEHADAKIPYLDPSWPELSETPYLLSSTVSSIRPTDNHSENGADLWPQIRSIALFHAHSLTNIIQEIFIVSEETPELLHYELEQSSSAVMLEILIQLESAILLVASWTSQSQCTYKRLFLGFLNVVRCTHRLIQPFGDANAFTKPDNLGCAVAAEDDTDVVQGGRKIPHIADSNDRKRPKKNKFLNVIAALQAKSKLASFKNVFKFHEELPKSKQRKKHESIAETHIIKSEVCHTKLNDKSTFNSTGQMFILTMNTLLDILQSVETAYLQKQQSDVGCSETAPIDSPQEREKVSYFSRIVQILARGVGVLRLVSLPYSQSDVGDLISPNAPLIRPSEIRKNIGQYSRLSKNSQFLTSEGRSTLVQQNDVELNDKSNILKVWFEKKLG